MIWLIYAQNICFFNVANNVANKINLIELNISIFNIINKLVKVIDEIKKI